MDIIISANEAILNMVKNKKIVIDENMTKNDFLIWTNVIVKDIDENEL